MRQLHLDEMTRNIDSFLASGQLARRAFFVFGHCHASEKMIDLLLAKDAAPSAILDNNPSKQGQTYRGIPIISPLGIDSNDSTAIVLIASRAYAAMAAQLGRMHYHGEIRKIVDYNTFAEYSLSDETFSQKKSRVARGIHTLERIKDQHPERYLIICPNDALGDVYLALSHLPEYCRRHEIAETVIVVTGNGCRQTAELFEPPHLITLGMNEMDELVQAVLFTRENNALIAHHDRPYTDNIIRYLEARFLSFRDFYTMAIYGLERDAPSIRPTGQEDFPAPYGMVKGKSAIFSPYAKSVVELPASFWEDMARKLHTEGLCVYTNTVGDEEPVKGTSSLSIPLKHMVSAVEFAGCFVGIRSGLCDIIAEAESRKRVIFPECIYSTTGVKVHEFFFMPGWENYLAVANSSGYALKRLVEPTMSGNHCS